MTVIRSGDYLTGDEHVIVSAHWDANLQQIKDLRDELDAAKEECINLTKENKRLKVQVAESAFTERIDDSTKAIRNLNDDIGHWRSINRTKERRIKELEGNLADLAERMEGMNRRREYHDSLIADRDARIAGMEQDIMDLKDDLAINKVEIEW